MKPTEGKVTLSEDGAYIDSSISWIASIEGYPDSPAGVRKGSDEYKANGALIVAAWNAAQEINPDNPIAAAEAMPEIWQAFRDCLNAFDYEGNPLTELRARQAISRARAAYLKATERE